MYIQRVIIIVLFCVCIMIYFKWRESFYVFPTNISNCMNCEFKNHQTCRECNNCGYCTNTNGESHCVSGDINGPNLNENCISWEYGYLLNNPNNNTPTQYYFTGYPRRTTNFNRNHRRRMQYTN